MRLRRWQPPPLLLSASAGLEAFLQPSSRSNG